MSNQPQQPASREWLRWGGTEDWEGGGFFREKPELSQAMEGARSCWVQYMRKAGSVHIDWRVDVRTGAGEKGSGMQLFPRLRSPVSLAGETGSKKLHEYDGPQDDSTRQEMTSFLVHDKPNISLSA
ncbi:hypothetical protein BU17DRAFT_72475 [Hysterangium stoloniferum]|nr:hypothetical protein BU17DRAFT_72475 [Hysterangium stoloniferum]